MILQAILVVCLVATMSTEVLPPFGDIKTCGTHYVKRGDNFAIPCHTDHGIQTVVSIATKLWKRLRGKNLDVYEGYLKGILGWSWGYSSATFCEFLLKPIILLENKIFMLQFILYGMFILYNVYYKCSPQAKFFKKWWLFFRGFWWIRGVMIGERG